MIRGVAIIDIRTRFPTPIMTSSHCVETRTPANGDQPTATSRPYNQRRLRHCPRPTNTRTNDGNVESWSTMTDLTAATLRNDNDVTIEDSDVIANNARRARTARIRSVTTTSPSRKHVSRPNQLTRRSTQSAATKRGCKTINVDASPASPYVTKKSRHGHYDDDARIGMHITPDIPIASRSTESDFR